MNITLKQLRVLREVVDARNFTTAAKRLHTTQSAISASIQELERSLGIKLIDRTTRQFALTNAGKEFLPAAIRILTDLQTSITNLSTLAALKRGTVIFGCPPAMASIILAKPIATFRQLHPGVNIVIKDNPTELSVGKLRSGELEIAIGTLATPEPDLLFKPLMSDRLIAVVHNESPLACRTTLSWRALSEYPVICPSKETIIRDSIDHAFLQATGKLIQPISEASFWITILAMVEVGLGIAITPSYALKYMPERKLRGLRLTHPTVSRKIGVIQHKDRILSPAASAFVDHLMCAHIQNSARSD